MNTMTPPSSAGPGAGDGIGPGPGPIDRIGSDQDAFEAFYRAHLPYVQRFVALRTTDPHTAADLVAETFLRVIDAAPGYRSSAGPPRAWLTGIARHVVQDHARSAHREQAAFGRLGGRRLLDEDSYERSVQRISAEASGRALIAALEELPPAQSEVVVLVAVDGLRIGEAAKALGITAGAARVRWHRARHTLRSVTQEQSRSASRALSPSHPLEVSP